MEAIPIQPNAVRAEAIRWLGGWHPLVRQIAPGEGFPRPDGALTPLLAVARRDAASLLEFLRAYKTNVLLPHELPAVQAASLHASRGEFQELIVLDRRLDTAGWVQSMADNSRRAGRAHLARLEPLRDHRGLRKYRHAVAAGEANGWHAVVAGLAMGLYALPLRQGLMDYAMHIFWSALEQSAGPAGLSAAETQRLVAELSEDLTGRIQQLFPAGQLVAV
jgi:urease accessory protein UreF